MYQLFVREYAKPSSSYKPARHLLDHLVAEDSSWDRIRAAEVALQNKLHKQWRLRWRKAETFITSTGY